MRLSSEQIAFVLQLFLVFLFSFDPNGRLSWLYVRFSARFKIPTGLSLCEPRQV